MKNTWKWIPALALALAAATAQAQQDWPDGEPGGAPPPPSARHAMQPDGAGGPPPPPHGMRDGGPDRKGPTPEQRAEFEAFRNLCKSVREETDEAKKAELVEELRAKLGKMADEQCAMQKERLADAEKRIAEQKARLDAQVEELRGRIEDEEAHRSEWIEEQVQCILSGERPPMRRMHRGPECKGPDAWCGDRPDPRRGKDWPNRCGGKFGMPPCGGEAGAPPPPPPPPPEEGGAMPPPDADAAE